jgi:2-iminobutanoate/2-iminopropanoate deaminase
VAHHRHSVTAPDAPEAVGAYSHAVVSNGLVFCSGQLPLDPASGELVRGEVGAQVTRCLDNLAAVCRSAGANLADALRVTVYLANLPADWGAANDAYNEYFGDAEGDPPARVAIGAAALPKGARVEVDAVVALPD